MTTPRSTPVAAAAYASTLCLPALSVALGRDHRHRHYHSSVAAGGEEATAASSQIITNVDNTVQLANRATNNVARMYARRILDAARLEREHPYYAAAPSSSASAVQATMKERTMTTKDEIVKGAFTTLIDIREKMNYIQTQLAASTSISHLHGGGNNNIAYCESSSAKQKTLEEYNKLNLQTFGTLDQYTVIDDNSGGDGSKPAEWSDHTIDLAKRRDEFGKQISPLTNVSAVARWFMAIKRVVTLSCLAMPLATLVPLNIVLGKLVSSTAATTNDDGDDAGTTTTTTKASYTKNTPSSTLSTNVGNKKKGGIAKRLHTQVTNKTWDYALWAIETAGPTYVKLIQWASTRHDLFSSEFVSHFSKLQDETRGHSWDETESTLVRAFGPNWRNIITFDNVIDDGEENNNIINNEHGSGSSHSGGGGELQRRGGVANRARQGRLEQQLIKKNKSSKSSSSSHPIGSGCVAQVYKARLTTSHGLHPPGTSVAVKVQHPHILEKVCLDFYIMNKVASFLEYIPYLNLDYLSVKDSVDQFRDIMLPQLDLRVEGHNLQRFRRDFDGETQIAFPEPLLGLTSREVLVEKFVEGEPMLNYVLCEDEKHSKKDREELATIGLETVMKMIFLHDFVHADLVSNYSYGVCIMFLSQGIVFFDVVSSHIPSPSLFLKHTSIRAI